MPEMPDKRKSSRLLHVNMLKAYHERDAKFACCVLSDVSVPVQLIDDPIDYGPDLSSTVVDEFKLGHLSDQQQNELSHVLRYFPHCLVTYLEKLQ